MSYNKYLFESYADFRTAQVLAKESGYKTADEFNKFLETNYSHLKK